VDPLAQTAAHASHRLDSENRRVRKKTESTRAAQAKKPKSSSRYKNQPARDVSSQLLFGGCGF
jgi:hemin uptake protein HemP